MIFFKKTCKEQHILFLMVFLPCLAILYASVNQSVWLDEALSITFSQESTLANIQRSITTDLHPPMYYILIKGLSIFFGNSIFVFRLYSFLLYLGAAYLFYLLISIWKKDIARIAAVIFFLWSPFTIYYASEVRSTMLVIFLSTLNFLSFYYLNSTQKISKKWIFYYLFSAIVGVYVYYPMIFLLLGEFFYILFFQRSHLWRNIVLQIIIGSIFSPWFFFAIVHRVGDSPSHFLSVPWWQIPAIVYLGFVGGRIPIVDVHHLHWFWPTAIIGIFSILNTFGLFFLWKKKQLIVHDVQKKVLFILLFVTVLCLFISATKISLFDPRYWTELSPLFLFLQAEALWGWFITHPRAAKFIFIGVFMAQLFAVGLYLFNPWYGREHWKTVVPALESESRVGDAVVFIGKKQPIPTYSLYQERDLEIVSTYSDDLKKTDDYANIEEHLYSSLVDNDRIWYSQFLEWQKDPEHRIREIIEKKYYFVKTIGFFKVKFDLYERK